MSDFNFYMVIGILFAFYALIPGYFIGMFFSSEEKSYLGYVWKGVWISAVALIGVCLLFYFAVQFTANS